LFDSEDWEDVGFGTSFVFQFSDYGFDVE